MRHEQDYKDREKDIPPSSGTPGRLRGYFEVEWVVRIVISIITLSSAYLTLGSGYGSKNLYSQPSEKLEGTTDLEEGSFS